MVNYQDGMLLFNAFILNIKKALHFVKLFLCLKFKVSDKVAIFL